jgi:hypothetical protein
MTKMPNATADHLLDSGSEIPTIELHSFDESILRTLQSLQRALLKHPVAFQAAFSGLIAEGEAFAKTPEGQKLKTTLEGSPFVQQLRYVFDLTTVSMLEREPPDILPSAYLDTLFMLAGSDRSDDLLDRLFGERT